MGWLLITFIGGLIGCAIAYFNLNKHKRNDWKMYFSYAMPWFIGTAFLSLIIGGTVAIVDSGWEPHEPENAGCRAVVVKYPIISVIRERTLSGSFILGTGGVRSIDKYYAYVEYERGMKLKTFYTSSTYIREGDWEPHYTRTDYLCERTFRNWFWFGTKEPRYNKGTYGTLYVPSNTILKEFKL